MRKVFGFICYGIMLAAYGLCGYFTYLACVQKVSYEQGLLMFVPAFIGSSWFSTFFSQLIQPRGAEPIINEKVYNILYHLSSLPALGLLGFWAYLIIDRKLYLTI